METTHKPLHLRQMEFGTVKDLGHTCKFFFNSIIFKEDFKYTDRETF
jgi:hypothetical protein